MHPLTQGLKSAAICAMLCLPTAVLGDTGGCRMKGLRALGLQGDWVLSTVEGTVSAGFGEDVLPDLPDEPVNRRDRHQ